jgi:CheY-like chemotaxis protein
VSLPTLLIVDDEPAIAKLIGRVAASAGYNAKITTCSEEFMDQVVAVDPAVIFLDLAMPGLDGVELLRYLSAVRSKAHIVILSGSDPRIVETSGRFGSNIGLRIARMLTKPVRVAELRELLHQLSAHEVP